MRFVGHRVLLGKPQTEQHSQLTDPSRMPRLDLRPTMGGERLSDRRARGYFLADSVRGRVIASRVIVLRVLLGAVLLFGVLWFLARTFRRWFGEARDALALRKAAAATASRPPREPTDPRTLFTEGAQLQARVRVEHIATLHVPTGKIIACDPLVFPDEPPFERSVPPGDYEVHVAVAQLPDQKRVAALRITFAPGTPVKFEATGSYGVDAGLGCFMDASTAQLLREQMDKDIDGDGNYFDDVLSKELGDGDWVDHRPVRDRRENVAIAHSGWGDGFYESYWGLDDAGEPVWLVTDFGVL